MQEDSPAAEAVEHAGYAARVAFEDFRQRFIGVSRMNDDRQSQAFGDLDLAPKRSLLHITRRVLVVEIEAGLAHRHHALFRTGQCLQPLQRSFGAAIGRMWVDPRGCEDPRGRGAV